MDNIACHPPHISILAPVLIGNAIGISIRKDVGVDPPILIPIGLGGSSTRLMVSRAHQGYL